MAEPSPPKQHNHSAPPPPFNNLDTSLLTLALEYVPGASSVISASVACREWHGTATSDVLWGSKFERELREKAERFGVEVPRSVEGCGGERASLSSSVASTTPEEARRNFVGNHWVGSVFDVMKQQHARGDSVGAAIAAAAATAAEERRPTLKVFNAIAGLKVQTAHSTRSRSLRHTLTRVSLPLCRGSGCRTSTVTRMAKSKSLSRTASGRR